jgi:hypothetical protein
VSDDGTDGSAVEGEAGAATPGDDPERAALIREVAREVRGESDESERVAAILFRVSDIYDPAEEADPESIYRNMRTVLQVSERGTLARDRD